MTQRKANAPEGVLASQLAEIRCWVVRFDETHPCGEQSPADCRAFSLAPGFRYRGELQRRIERAVAAPCRHIPTPPFARDDHPVVVLHRPDTDYQISFTFQKSDCWQLVHKDDQSL